MADAMDAVFKAFADASRRELLDELRAENGQTMSELCARPAITGARRLHALWLVPAISLRQLAAAF